MTTPRPRPRAILAFLGAVLTFALIGLPAAPAGADQNESALNRVAAASVTAGSGHTCALLASGAVRCWGENSQGQLGLGNTNDLGDNEAISTAPTVPLGGPATAIAAGGVHTCALLTSGSVRCWGANGDGQLGLGNTNALGDNEAVTSAPPVPLGARAIAIAAGASHSCALLETGAVRCWGDNSSGQLGLGNTNTLGDDEAVTSAPVIPLGAAATAISAGTFHTCALLVTGAVRCWGYNALGQLGLGNNAALGDDEAVTSAPVVPLGAAATAITTGNNHTCALLAGGAVRCWGVNSFGELGLGNTNTLGNDEPISTAPTIPLDLPATAVSAGDGHTCVLLTSGAVRCFGNNNSGELGIGSTSYVGDNEAVTSVPVVPLGAPAIAVTTGSFHTCALFATGALRCWGANSAGQLGLGNSNNLGDDEAIGTASPVPLGAAVRVHASATHDLKASKRHDRKRPFKFHLRGTVRGAFVADAATCTGTVKIVAKAPKGHGHKKIRKTKYATLHADSAGCSYARTIKLRHAGRYRVVATLPTTNNLAWSRDRIKVRAG